MTIKTITSRESGQPNSFIRILSRRSDGSIVLLEYGTTRNNGDKRKQYQLIRMSPDDAIQGMNDWASVQISHRFAVLYLHYAIKNLDEFDTGVATAVPEDVLRWAVQQYRERNEALKNLIQGDLGL